MVLEPSSCGALQRKVNVLKALFRSPPVMTRHSVVVLQPVVDVFVDLTVEGRWRARSDWQEHDGGGTSRGLGLLALR
ncbi:MAG: hypothetical protein PV344_02305, partial [Anaplasma sp.]|nr:hypothetical protein [Anaplasma sp.]